MADYAPPTGPPPPKVPEGWKAVWNDQYSEWFFVNIYTKKSQWDKPTEPIYPPGEAPDAPPSYAPPHKDAALPTDGKLGSNNPYSSGAAGGPPTSDLTEDEKLARRLQEEEDARARGHGEGQGAANAYFAQGSSSTPQPGQYGYGQQSPYPEQSTQDKGKSKGLIGKLLGKASGSSKPHGYPQQQQGYGAPYGQPGYGQPGYGQPGYYPQQPGYGYAQPARKHGGMGAGGAAALGVGGGLVGGMLLGEMAADAGDGGDGGGDYGGDGGDFGGDGGGDFGGGDF